MMILYIIAMIGDPFFAVGGIAVGLLARRRLHLLGAALLSPAWLLFHETQNVGEYLAPSLVVALTWAAAAFLVKRALQAS